MSEFESTLIEAMKEAVAISKGELDAKTHYFPSPKEVRIKAKLTQAQMAPLMGMSLSGYRKWEQGQRGISGPALNLLKVLDKNPKAVLEALA